MIEFNNYLIAALLTILLFIMIKIIETKIKSVFTHSFTFLLVFILLPIVVFYDIGNNFWGHLFIGLILCFFAIAFILYKIKIQDNEIIESSFGRASKVINIREIRKMYFGSSINDVFVIKIECEDNEIFMINGQLSNIRRFRKQILAINENIKFKISPIYYIREIVQLIIIFWLLVVLL